MREEFKNPNHSDAIDNQKVHGLTIEARRHSAAHVLAQAVLEKYPDANLAIGPSIDNGFYYDILTSSVITSDDLADLEQRMKQISKEKQKFVRFSLPLDEAIQYLEKNGQKFKVEMALDLGKKGEKEISFYKNVHPQSGEVKFTDMCAGPHVNHTGEIGVFKLTSVSGAYWRGDSKREQLQRIYGILFETAEELKAYEHMMEEAKKRDHRKLGAELELFATSEKIGPGLILWLPRGQIIRDQLEAWAKETEAKYGYERVSTPAITKEELFYISEHLPHYKDNMFPPMQLDNENYYLKPMNCPFHHIIYGMRPRSYRELPLRLAEYGINHRYEDSGGLFGLMRVRAMTMNDAHIYCTEEQAVDEFVTVLKMHDYYYKKLGITEYYMELALRNPENDKYHGDNAMWEKAESLMRKAMEVSGIEYKVENDGAAFYGPKVDFQIKSSIGREFTASTCQLDLFMPVKFDLKYVDKDGTLRTPVIIHRSPLGTHERFTGFLIEHFGGAFPLWLAPEQIRILPVSEKYIPAAKELALKLKEQGFRVHVDDSDETLGKRIRNAEKMKIPRMIVLGEKETESGMLNVRNFFSGIQSEMTLENFIKEIKHHIAEKTIEKMEKKSVKGSR